MNSDFYYLGYCHQWEPLVAPLCLHAYAITASGAFKLTKNFQLCSNQLADYQLSSLARQNVFTWQRSKYRTVYNTNHTNGLFTQNWGEDAKLFGHLFVHS